MWFLGAGKGKGWEGGRERRGPWGFVFLKVLNLLFYSVFYDPVRINYNLPAGYLSSAVTYSVMAEALYPHGRLYLILSPSPFPSLSLTQIPRKSPRKEEENSPPLPPKITPKSSPSSLSFSLFFQPLKGCLFLFRRRKEIL